MLLTLTPISVSSTGAPRGRNGEHPPVEKRFQLYIVKCADGTYYTGVSTNLEQRIAQHERGYFGGSYTQKRLPVVFKFAQDFNNWDDAAAAEKRVSKWSQEKKEKLISGEWGL